MTPQATSVKWIAKTVYSKKNLLIAVAVKLTNKMEDFTADNKQKTSASYITNPVLMSHVFSRYNEN